MIKLNWGFGIALGYTAFAAGMIFLVTLCAKQKVDLVSEDYYKQELNYQQNINSRENLAALNTSVLTILQGSVLKIILPVEQSGEITNGQVYFYKPDNSTLDKKITFTNLAENIYNADISNLKKGLWRVQINWTAKGKNFYHQSDINCK